MLAALVPLTGVVHASCSQFKSSRCATIHGVFDICSWCIRYMHIRRESLPVKNTWYSHRIPTGGGSGEPSEGRQ